MTKISRRDFGKLAASAAAGIAAPAIWSGANAQSQPIRVGTSASLTGPLSGISNMVLGYELWRDDVNAAGGLLGRKVELVIYDDQSAVANVPSIYSKLIDVDKCDLLMTPYGTNLTVPIMPMIKQRGLAIISSHSMAVKNDIRSENFFLSAGWGPNPTTGWAQGFFDLVQAQKLKKIAIIAADTEFSKTAAEGGVEVCKKYGIEVVMNQYYPPTTTDFSSILRNIKAANADAVFVCSYPRDSSAMIRGISEIGIGDNVQLFGGGMVGPQYASIMQSLGSALNGVVNFHLYVPEPTMKFQGIEGFLARYAPLAAERKMDPLGFYVPPFTYAAGQLYAAAVKATGTLDNKKIGQWLHSNTVDTIVGQQSFDEFGDWKKRRVLMVQFQGLVDNDVEQFRAAGKQVVLDPSELKSGDFKPLASLRKK
jgi:branched-chain amino acid transport system substrate-binding protein